MRILPPLLGVVPLLTGCCAFQAKFLSVQSSAPQVRAEDVALHALPASTWPHAALATALDALGERIAAANALIVFVHGRGRQPEKAFEGGQLARLEELHGLPVLLLRWPAWTSALDLPAAQARGSGPYLREVVQQLVAYRAEHPGVRIHMLVHSMGNQVLESAARLEPPLRATALTSLVLTGADVDLDGHAAWVERCTFTEQVLVITNRDDSRLCITAAKYGRPRLGQGLAGARPAANARYIALDGCDPDHEYFLSDAPRPLGVFRLVLGAAPQG